MKTHNRTKNIKAIKTYKSPRPQGKAPPHELFHTIPPF